ncbi:MULTISPECIES: plasmid partition protein ParG [Crystallibacter]|uniref:plasmid partition protein ParG n=1 Tax=Crystallibacter TaxID=3456524 RepID=UPI0011112C7D|nr:MULTISPECIES: plasmid partition protein ParG [Arthrobacter]NMR32468.1 chromosome partitioning protein ParB [Arthrobacter sp. SF27]
MSKFAGLSTGRPSVTNAAKAKLLESLKDDAPQEPLKRVNFQVAESKHTKLKVHAAKKGQSVREFLTDYIDSLPDS